MCASLRAGPGIAPSSASSPTEAPSASAPQWAEGGQAQAQPVVIYLEDHIPCWDDDYARWLDEHVAHGVCSAPSPVGAPPVAEGDWSRLEHGRRTSSWVITGERHGVRVRICTQCARDRPCDDAGWDTCQCGATACIHCLRNGCRICGRCGPHSVEGHPGASSAAAAQLRDDHAAIGDRGGDLTGGETWAPCHFEEPESWVVLDVNSEEQQPRADDTSLGRCVTCLRWLGEWGVCWRICTCGAAVCTDCGGHQCPSCRGASERAPPRLGEEHSEQPQGVQPAGVEGHEPTALAGLPTPPPVTLEEAHANRLHALRQAKEARKKDREYRRGLRTECERRGLRPLRPVIKLRRASFVTANVTAATSLIEELRFGTALQNDDYLLIQELACGPDATEVFTRDMIRLGYSPVVQRSYYKSGGYGGGTVIAARGEGGVRPLPASEFSGRCLYSIVDLGIEVLSITVYGLSGAGAKAQLNLWMEVASRIRATGRPFIIGGDWQVDPVELIKAKFEQHLDASVIYPPTPTNRVTGTRIDYFVISNCLLSDSTCAETVEGCRFTPHAPVRVVLETRGSVPPVRKLDTPRTLPVERPIGPLLPAPQVKWDQWCHEMQAEADERPRDLDVAALQWSAGAEVELLGIFGRSDDDALPFRGIGMARQEVWGAPERSFRNTPDAQGLIGHRLNWTARHLHLAAVQAESLIEYGKLMVAQFGREGASRRQAGRASVAGRLRRARGRIKSGHCTSLHDSLLDVGPLPEEDNPLPWQYDVNFRVASRAAAFLCEKRPPTDRAEDIDAVRELNAGLRLLASLARATRGRVPLLDRWCRGEADENVAAFIDMRDRVTRELHQLSLRRSTRLARGTRRWAQCAALAGAHKATKVPEAAPFFSASASKSHLGALGPQEAADSGMQEWSSTWKARDQDITNDIMSAVEAVEVVERLHGDLVLPPFTVSRLFRASSTFPGRTAVGACGLRPRHLLLLTTGARRALCLLLQLIETARRWPSSLREVVEVALSKRTGGSRLIGLAPTLYRLWARVRYQDCRSILEDRIERPYLAAAPKRGAVRAAFDAARSCEIAVARNSFAAATILDIAQYYEFIEASEYAASAAKFGVPPVVISLATHLYLAPRRIRVRSAYSAAVIPRRSVVAGCTWATVLIRLIVILPAEALLRQIREKLRAGEQVSTVQYTSMTY